MPVFSAEDLGPTFSATASTIETNSVAFTGILPTSTIFHLAINHLQRHEHYSAAVSPSGPLPEPSEPAPKRIKLDHAPSGGHVLILTPDRNRLRKALIREKELHLFGNTRSAKLAALLENIEIKYLPTCSHLQYFLYTLYSHLNHTESRKAFEETGTKLKQDASYLPKLPTMVILHNLTDYLAEERANKAGIEFYASLLAQFVSTFTQLHPDNPPLLVLHDLNAHDASVAVMPTRIRQTNRQDARGSAAGHLNGSHENEAEKVKLLQAINFHFDWIGLVEKVNDEKVDDPIQDYELWLKRSMRRQRSSEISVSADLTKRFQILKVEAENFQWHEQGSVIKFIS